MAKFKNPSMIAMAIIMLVSMILPSFVPTRGVAAVEIPRVSQSCANMIQGYVDWANKSANNMVDVQLVGVSVQTRDPNARHRFGFGRWAFARMEAKGNGIEGVLQEYFSDRMDGQQPFARKKTDLTRIHISPKDGVTLTLLSWGNGKAEFRDFSCPRDGFIVITAPDGWETVYTIALVKTYR